MNFHFSFENRFLLSQKMIGGRMKSGKDPTNITPELLGFHKPTKGGLINSFVNVLLVLFESDDYF
jgi:hypothetical protein